MLSNSKPVNKILTAVISLIFLSLVPSQLIPVFAQVSVTQSMKYSVSNGWVTRGLAIDRDGYVYILNTLNNLNGTLLKLNGDTGAIVATYASPGTDDGKLNTSRGISIDNAGNIYIADSNNNRVQIFSNAGVYSTKFGSSGSGNGQFNNPGGIAVDSSGNIFVSDTGNNRIQKFNSSGVYQSQFGGSGSGDGQLSSPQGIFIDQSGNIFVADSGNNRIQKFTSAGAFSMKFGSSGTGDGQMASPQTVAVDSLGKIYVGDTNNARIEIFDGSGNYISKIISTDFGGNKLVKPVLTVDTSGNIYTGNNTTSYLMKFTYGGTGYQISGLDSSLDVLDLYNKLSVKSSGTYGVNDSLSSLRLITSGGRWISDVTANLTSDLDWSAVSVATDSASGKSVISNLVGVTGVVGNPRTIYIPVPDGRTSSSVYLCPEAATLGEVSTSCTHGVSVTTGSYSESFGNITVSQVTNAVDHVAYWKVAGMQGGGGVTTGLVEFSGSGGGTAVSPYQLTTCSQLEEMANNRAAYYVLTGNIDCSDTVNWNSGSGFIPVGTTDKPFSGNVDGQNFSINNVYINKTTSYIGLFGYAYNATLTRIIMDDISYNVNGSVNWSVLYTGALVGMMDGGTLSYSSSSGAIGQTVMDGWTGSVGGLVGQMNSNAYVHHSSSSVSITLLDDPYYTGGLIGWSQGTALIEDSHSSGNISVGHDGYEIGGFIGWALGNTTINRCYSTGNVQVGVGAGENEGDDYDHGGFAGAINGNSSNPGTVRVDSSYATGNVTVYGEDNYDIGGFVGTAYDGSYITNSHASGTVTNVLNGYGIGGFAGLTRNRFSGTDPVIQSSYSTGTVYTGNNVYDIGGFVGEHRAGTIETSYSSSTLLLGNNEGDGSEAVSYAGGFAGKMTNISANPAQILKSYSTGLVKVILSNSNIWDIGGFIGSGTGIGIIDQCASQAKTVYGWGDLGGFAGSIASGNASRTFTVSNSYSRTNVVSRFSGGSAGNVDLGGFVGYLGLVNVSSIQNSYSTGTITSVQDASASSGGFSGNTGTVTNSYWDVNTSAYSTSFTGTGLGTGAMKTQGSFSGWDFSNIWSINPDINNGYPSLNNTVVTYTTIYTNHNCSGSCNSGSTCNQYGDPPEGQMWSCKLDGAAYKCAYTYPNEGEDHCYLSCNDGWQPCGCDESACVNACTYEHYSDPIGHYTYTSTCAGCGQKFTCGCDIGPKSSPIPTPMEGGEGIICNGVAYTGCGGTVYELPDSSSDMYYTDDPDCSSVSKCGYTYNAPTDFNSSYCGAGDGCDCWWFSGICTRPTATPTANPTPTPALLCDSQSYCGGTHYYISNGGTAYESDDPDCAGAQYCSYTYTPTDPLRQAFCGGNDGCDCFWQTSWCSELTPTPTPTIPGGGYNLYVPEGFTGRLANNINKDLSVEKVAGPNLVRIARSAPGLAPLADVTVNFTSNLDWTNSGLIGGTDNVQQKSYIHALASQQSAASNFTLYVPIKSGLSSSQVVICPGAENLDQVTSGCANANLLTEASSGVSKINYNGFSYWKVSGLTGTGGLAINDSFTVSDALTRLKTSTVSDHTITFGTVNGLTAAGNTTEISMPAWNLSGLTVADLKLSVEGTALNLADSASTNTWGVTISGGSITLTAPTADSTSGYITADSTIVLQIGLGAGGTHQLVNPAAVNVYDINITNSTPEGLETGMGSVPIVDSDVVDIIGYVNTFIDFDIDTAVSDTDCAYNSCTSHSGGVAGVNYTVDLGELNSTWVNKSNSTSVMHSDGNEGIVNSIWFDLTTNALSGAVLSVKSANGALQGPGTSMIASVTDGQNISPNDGTYGYQMSDAGTGNGTIIRNSNCVTTTAYCGLTTGQKEVFNTNGKPIDNGRLKMDLAAAAAYIDNPGSYTDTLTFIVTATY